MPDQSIIELDQFWDAWLSGNANDPSSVDLEIANVVFGLHNAVDVEDIDPARISQIWNDLMRERPRSAIFADPNVQMRPDLMNLTDVTEEISPRSLMKNRSSRYGRVWPRFARSGSIRKSSTAVSRHDGQLGFAHRAITAVMVIALVLGYFAFEPLRSGDDRPQSVPGGVIQIATPDQGVTSTPFPLTGHTIVGVWSVDYSANPGTDIKIYSFGADGKYSNTNNHRLPRVTMGQWRATGERTLELVCIEQMIQLHGLWDPQILETVPYLLDANVQFWRLSITVDESGNSFVGTGGYTYYDGEGSVLWTVEDIQVIGTLMEVVTTETEDTPEP